MTKPKPVKILCSTYWYPEFAGDIHATYVHDINRYLVKAGCEVVTVTPNYGKSMVSEKYDGVQIERFSFPVPVELSYGKVAQSAVGGVWERLKKLWIIFRYFLLNFWFTLRAIKKYQPNVVHAHWAIPSGLPALLAAKLTGRPCVITMHGGDVYYNPTEGYVYPKLWYVKPFLKLTLAWANKLTAITDDCRQHALRAGASDRNMIIVSNGADLERFSPTVNSNSVKGNDGDDKIIFSCRQLIPRKGMRYLIQAMPMIVQKFPKVKLVIAGDGMERSDLEKLIVDLSLTENVSLLGWIDNSLLPDYYRRADVVVMPSLEEGFGIPAAEAMGCAVPVVSTDAGGLVEVVDHGITGLIVPKADTTALAEAILEVLVDPERAKQMGEAGRRRALEKFDWKVTTERFSSLFNELLDVRK